jgi:hypothetical protein
MSKERNRILGLLAAGKINEEEAARLLDALEASTAPAGAAQASRTTAGSAGTPNQAAPQPPTAPYPLTLVVDYPERPLARLSSALRFLWIIPIGVIAALVGSGTFSGEGVDYSWSWAAGGILSVPVLLMLLFRQKYPRWWFDWNLNLTRFLTRVGAYALLLRDEYPSTDEEQAVHLDFAYPDAKQLSRWLPLVKWFLVIPHWIVLCFLWIGVMGCVIIAWFAILFTGRYPRGLFRYVVGVDRWSLRVAAYSLLLITDKYPPFSLS